MLADNLDLRFQIGQYSFTVEMVPEIQLEVTSFVDVRITTKSRNMETPPFETRCWASIGNAYKTLYIIV